MEKKSLWEGFKRRAGKLVEEAKKWFDDNLKGIFSKNVDQRPFWMQLLQWVTGGVIKMDNKSLEKNKDDVWTLTRTVLGFFAGLDALKKHFFPKDEDAEKRAEEAKKEKAKKIAETKEKSDKDKKSEDKDNKETTNQNKPTEGISKSSGDHSPNKDVKDFKPNGVEDVVNDLKRSKPDLKFTEKMRSNKTLSHVQKQENRSKNLVTPVR